MMMMMMMMMMHLHSDLDDFFGEEDLKQAFMLITRAAADHDQPMISSCTSTSDRAATHSDPDSDSDSRRSSSSSDDDISILHRLQDQFSSVLLPSPPSNINETLMMTSTCLPPAAVAYSGEDDDDFATLREIRMRFMRQEDQDQDGCDCIISSNKETSGSIINDRESSEKYNIVSNSRFPISAHNFLVALKKNRACQNLIKKKMLRVEENLEKVNELKNNLRYLMGLQLAVKRRLDNQIGQKKDPRIRLISTEKKKLPPPPPRAKTRKAAPFCYGPQENPQVKRYKTVLERFPMSHRKQPWTDKEKEMLAMAIEHQLKEQFLCDQEYANPELQNSLITDYRAIQVTSEMIKSFLPGVDWQQLASQFLPDRSAEECESRWLNCEDPTINNSPWTATEEKKLLLTVDERGVCNWIDLAGRLGINRTPFQCLVRYQRSLNPNILRKDWTKDEDEKLHAAIEDYGDNNWQLVASCLEGRTGTQCSYRWRNTLKPQRKRVGRWSIDEDKRLKAVVLLFGAKNWNKIAQFVHGRTQVQCRERWVNVLDPLLNLQSWTTEEDGELLKAIAEHGYRWSKISTCVPPRTDSQCRRRWKVLLPDEVLLRQALTMIRKTVLVSNFVDRENERPNIGPEDFELLQALKTQKKRHDVRRRCKRKREREREREVVKVSDHGKKEKVTQM